MYEKAKNYAASIRVYDILGEKYPKSSFALEAMFSVPLIHEKQGNHSQAVAAYKSFIDKYQKDPQKLIRAQLAAGRIYDMKLGKNDEALKYYEGVNRTYQQDKEKKIPGAIPAEAAFRGGQIYYKRVLKIRLDASKKENAKRLKQMTTVLQTAVEHFTVAMEMEEREWTLRSTMRIGDLFMAMASITGNEKIQTKNKMKIIGEKINMLRGLPKLYAKARGMYQKNLDLGREQSFKDKWIDSCQVKYMNTYWLEGQVFEQIGQLLGSAPIPPGLSDEEERQYKELLKDKIYEAEWNGARPIYKTSLKAAQFYGIENEIKRKIKERLRQIDPEAPELELRELTPAERKVSFVDKTYKGNMEKINKVYESTSMGEKKKIEQLKKMEATAKREIERLTAELNQLKSQGGSSSP
jgi:tetratricopeptide (TPR) repeat protein